MKPNNRSRSEIFNFVDERAHTEYEFDDGISVQESFIDRTNIRAKANDLKRKLEVRQFSVNDELLNLEGCRIIVAYLKDHNFRLPFDFDSFNLVQLIEFLLDQNNKKDEENRSQIFIL